MGQPKENVIPAPPVRVEGTWAISGCEITRLTKDGSRIATLRREGADLFLTTVNEFKTELVAKRDFQRSYKRRVLEQSMPKFLWRATARTRGRLVFDLLFDATDIEQGDLFVRAVEYDQIFGKYFRSVCKEPSLKKFFRNGLELRVIEWFANT
jgi:hypothetical protein